MKDKITRYVENGLEGEVSSPMDPPQPYHLSGIEKVVSADMAEPLRQLITEHNKYLEVFDAFEKSLMRFKDRGWVIDEEVNAGLRAYFHYRDHEAPKHDAKEEKYLFPVLHKKLIAIGECSPGEHPTTSVDVMEDDHSKVAQASCLVFNLLGIGSRLKDPEARNTVFQIAFDQGREIIETMRLHVFKENEVLFPQAQKLIDAGEFRAMAEQMKRYA